MKTSDFLREHNACREGAHWALSVSNDMSVVWEALIAQGRHEWLVWAATRPNVFPDSTLRKLACRFVRETPLHDGRKVWDLLTDQRSRRAVEVAEAYSDGQATEDDLDSARSAAWAAANAAWAADAAYVAGAAYDSTYAAGAARIAEVAARLADASCAAAESAQLKRIAELGNPFNKGTHK